MSEWKTVRLREICDSIDYGLTASASTDAVGPRFLRITDIVGPTFDWVTVPYVEVSSSQAEKYRLHHGDIVIARTGATTGASRWIANPPDAVFASYLVRLKISDHLDSRFVGYLLKSDQFWSYIRGVLGDKSAQPNASATTLTNAPIRSPAARSVQVAIAEVLGALDDKIAVSERIARDAERLAAMLVTSAGALGLIALSKLAEPVREQIDPRALDAEVVANFSIPAYDSFRLPDLVSPQPDCKVS